MPPVQRLALVILLSGVVPACASSPPPNETTVVAINSASPQGGAAPRPMAQSPRAPSGNLPRGCATASYIAPSSSPQNDEEMAKQLYASGLEAFRSANFALAVDRWCGSFTLHPTPASLGNLGEAFDRSGRTNDAIDAFERAQREYQAQGQPREVERLEKRIAKLRSQR